MVGVAGKSKGCTTCRRRKIRCDLQRPACSNCIKATRICEGYDRYPVFLNRTQEGLERRGRLEEAKTGSPGAPSSDLLSLPQELSRRSLNEAQIISWFWEHYAPPVRPADARTGYAGWLYYAISISPPPPALRQSLLALAVTRHGRVIGDDGLFRRGRQIYSLALQLLQPVLNNETMAWTDETLAGVRSMVLYEFLESTSEDPTAWYNHLDGLEKLLQMRGPQQHTSGIAKAVLEDVRYPLMMKAIMKREISPFGEQQWLTEPWVGTKGTDQLVLDHGFLLASLLQRADSLRESLKGLESLQAAVQLLRECNVFHQSLEDLYENELTEFPMVEWRRVERLVLILTIYTMQLLVVCVMDPLCHNLSAAGHAVPTLAQRIRELVAEAARHITSQQDLARKIRNGANLCLGAPLEPFGLSRTIFPLNMLLWYHRHSEREFQEILAMKRKIGREDELRFAANLNRGECIVPRVIRDASGLTKSQSSQECVEE